jgi:hypothetical protein
VSRGNSLRGKRRSAQIILGAGSNGMCSSARLPALIRYAGGAYVAGN